MYFIPKEEEFRMADYISSSINPYIGMFTYIPLIIPNSVGKYSLLVSGCVSKNIFHKLNEIEICLILKDYLVMTSFSGYEVGVLKVLQG